MHAAPKEVQVCDAAQHACKPARFAPYNDAMAIYRESSEAIGNLYDGERVHRDAYLSTEIFALEMERLFARRWLYAGHMSQVPQAGDFITLEIAGTTLLMIRQADGGVQIMANRCAHKGAMLRCQASGHVDRAIQCPYHAWSYRLDGSLLAVPLREGYQGSHLATSEAAGGLTRFQTTVYRDFVFVCLDPNAAGLTAQVPAELLGCLDAMADRSPLGRLEVAGPCLRNVIECNWKIYLENINDTVHANVTHESSALSAEAVWQRTQSAAPSALKKPMAIEQLLPFSSGSDFMEKMGGRVWAGGHSILGIHASLHSDYSSVPGYEQAMIAAWGETRAKQILAWSPQNALIYPSIAFKSAPQTLRVIRPLGVSRTLVEIWAFRALGAPDVLLERTQTYNRIVFSPMSIVAHDDVQVFESIQRGLAGAGNEWVSLHRGHAGTRAADGSRSESESVATVGGTDERLMRNQYRAWLEALVPSDTASHESVSGESASAASASGESASTKGIPAKRDSGDAPRVSSAGVTKS